MIRVLLRCGAESYERGGGFDHAALAWHQSALAAVDPLVSFRLHFGETCHALAKTIVKVGPGAAPEPPPEHIHSA